ncbi:hypothetical protein [Streptomyces sp. NPDC002671]
MAESPDWRAVAADGVPAYAQALLHNLTSWFEVDALYGDSRAPASARPQRAATCRASRSTGSRGTLYCRCSAATSA